MRQRLGIAGLMALGLAAGTPAKAPSATVSYSASFPMSATDWNGTLYIPRFDPSLGTLTGIDFLLAGSVMGDAKFENLDAESRVVTTNLQARITLSRPDLSAIAVTTPAVVNVDSAGAFDDVVDYGGPSGRTYLGLVASAFSSASSLPPNDGFVAAAGGGFHTLGIRNPLYSAVEDAVSGRGVAPISLRILAVIPNPIEASAVIHFEVRDPGALSITVHDIAGRQISTAAMGSPGPGRHQVRWDARDATGVRLASGVYFVRLRGNGVGSPAVRVLLVR